MYSKVKGSLGFMYWDSVYTGTCISWMTISCFASHLCAAVSTVDAYTHAALSSHIVSSMTMYTLLTLYISASGGHVVDAGVISSLFSSDAY